MRNIFFIISLLLLLTSCREEEMAAPPDYTRAGEPVTLRVPVVLPKSPEVSRAPLDEPSLNEVESLWIRTYSSLSGEATSEWITVAGLPTHDSQTVHDVTISTLSGPSYIVAVANVDNLGVLKSDITTERPLRELLTEADTWQQFLDIAVDAPSNPVTVRAPVPPLVMTGSFTTIPVGGAHPAISGISEWQTRNFQSYFIPVAEGVADFSDIGAIHLRRVVSHVNFNVLPADNLTVEVNSYQVMNAPRWSWLYERPAANGMLTNFGDLATTEEEAEQYYADIPLYAQQFVTANDDGTSSFDFWQGENKHTGTATTYADRAKRNAAGHFASLSGDTWSRDDEASYVLISCSITYNDPIKVNPDGAADPDGEYVDRTAEAVYLIHLGALADDYTDFNCYRNVNYTYNLHINGVDDIRVDAFATDETYHPEEGLVVDLSHNTIELDAHYAVFNIQLTEAELRNESFGFLMVTYDNGRAIEISDSQPRNADGEILDSKGNIIDQKYHNWVELRPTTGQYVLADYKPRFGANADGKTFLLSDLYRGWDSMTDAMKAGSEGWYTVYVNEYTYEPIYTGTNGYADETTAQGARPAWMNYVNQPPRSFYILVSRQVSPDGASAYSRSKYGVSQQSIQSYYSQLTETPTATAIGVEHTNETLGMNMGHQFPGGSSQANGRLNTAEWLKFQPGGGDINANPGPAWTAFIRPNAPLQVPAVRGDRAQGGWELPDRTIAAGNPLQLAAPVQSSRAGFTFNDPQGNNNYNVEGINACLNRNRDNNGNGRIDPDELRWYLPAIHQYVYLFLGKNSLTDPMMPYERITRLPLVLNNEWSTAPDAIFKDGYYPRYMFMASNTNVDPTDSKINTIPNVMWCMEGTSTSTFGQVQEWSSKQSRPWNLRCIRNLGSDLTNVNEGMKVTIPYVHDPAARTLTMTYFDLASVRVNAYGSNGTGAGQMPIHTIASPYNSVFYGLEYAPEDITIPREKQPATTSTPEFNATFGRIADYIYSNPCEERFGTGWRIPNQIELTMIWDAGGVLSSSLAASCWLTCTVNTFNRFTAVNSLTDVDDRLFMVLQQSHGSQLTQDNLQWAVPNNNQSVNNLFVRCVRDKR